MSPAMTIHLEVAGHLSAVLAECFEPLVVTPLPTGDTAMAGTLADQSAAHAVCNRVRDLGLTLRRLTITRKESA